MSITITLWSGVRVAHGGVRRTFESWEAFVAWLTPADPRPFAGEDAHPGWSAATFRGDHRKKDGIEALYLLTAEHDAGTVSPEEAAEALTGLQAIIVTTKSHTAERPRWRLVVAVSRPFTVAERDAVLVQLPPLELARAESTDAARFWFVTTAGAQAVPVEGEPIDVDQALASQPEPQPAPAPYVAPEPHPHADRYIARALDAAAEELARAVPGERHNVASRQAYSLGGLVGSGLLDLAVAERALLQAMPASWDASTRRDLTRTVRGQLQEGAKRPRHPPAPRVPFAPSHAVTAHAIEVPVSQPALAADVTPLPVSHLRAVPDNASPLAETILGVRAKLLTSNNGSPRKIVANATTIFALDPRWSGVLAYQALADRVVKLKAPEWHADDAPATVEPGPWTDADTTRAQAWLSREYGLDIGAETANAAVQAAAERRWIDPLKDYFDRVRGTWDQFPRVDQWLTTVFNAPDTPYTRAVGRRWLISCVARALRPGCQVDHVLTLEGLQGKGKSSALRALCPDEDLFFDSELSIGDKDAVQVLRGKWIIELGELSSLNRHEIQVVKAFITRRIDTYRPSFGRRPVDAKRRFAFSASTNEEEYLKDPTGNRRWWPVKVRGPVDVPAVERHRDQIWAEALDLFEAGQPWHLETEELRALAADEQSQREPDDVWSPRVGSWLALRLENAEADHAKPRHPEHSCPCVYCAGVTTTAVLESAVKVTVEKQDKAQEMRVANILRRAGWIKAEKRVTQDDGSRTRPFYPST